MTLLEDTLQAFFACQNLSLSAIGVPEPVRLCLKTCFRWESISAGISSFRSLLGAIGNRAKACLYIDGIERIAVIEEITVHLLNHV
jgi:hypothetical protein